MIGHGSTEAGEPRIAWRDARVRSHWWIEALVVVWLCWLYDLLAGLAPLRRAAAVAHGRGIMHLERLLHLDPELALNRWLAGRHTLALALSDYYDNAHFIVTLGVLAWLWWSRPAEYRPLRNVLVLINLIGFAVFWLYPVAPPRLLPGGGYSDVVAMTHAIGSSHASGPLAADADQFAAMPSLHIAWAAWCLLVAWRVSRRRLIRGLAAAHLILTWFAVLATANHFLVDVLAGLATAALALCCVRAAASARLANARVSAVTKLLRSPPAATLADDRHTPL